MSAGPPHSPGEEARDDADVATVRPFLMFAGDAEAAMKAYVALFPGSRVLSLERWDDEEAGEPGAIKAAALLLGDQIVMCADSPAAQSFTFTPSFSLYVTLPSVEEVERVVDLLSENGEVLMPLDDYGFNPAFAWIQDRFGVSWQISVR